MKIGIVYWATDQTWAPPQAAVEIEERGFDSLFLGEHTHVPTGWREAHPEGGGTVTHDDGSEPALLGAPEYKRLLEPFTTLAAAAVSTERIRLGTAVCLVAQHDPILLAKATATIDHLSGGRFDFGVGFGWNVQEMANHGVDASRRHRAVREKVKAIRSLWTEDVAAGNHELASFSPSWMWPKPLQQPNPPILMGADGPVGIRHTVEYADGWMPVAGKVVDKLEQLRVAAEAVGRDPALIPITVTSPRPTIEALRHYWEAGIDRVLLWIPPPCTRDHVLTVLDEWATFLPEVKEARPR
jgi:probable F420-dependent oxidoreductase